MSAVAKVPQSQLRPTARATVRLDFGLEVREPLADLLDGKIALVRGNRALLAALIPGQELAAHSTIAAAKKKIAKARKELEEVLDDLAEHRS